jgi:hypothetical protein
MLVVALLVLAAVSLPLPVLTGLGAHRRGLAIPLAVLTGLCFPVTWTVWYLRDEHPYRRPPPRTAVADRDGTGRS